MNVKGNWAQLPEKNSRRGAKIPTVLDYHRNTLTVLS